MTPFTHTTVTTSTAELTIGTDVALRITVVDRRVTLDVVGKDRITTTLCGPATCDDLITLLQATRALAWPSDPRT